MSGKKHYHNKKHVLSYSGIVLCIYCLFQFFSLLSRVDFLVVELVFCLFFLFLCHKRLPLYVFISAIFLAVQFFRYYYDYNNNSNEGVFYSPINFVVKFFSIFIVALIVTDLKNIDTENRKNVIIITLIASIFTDLISFYYLKNDIYAIRYRAKFYDSIANGETYFGIITFAEVFAFSILVYLLIRIVMDNRFVMSKKRNIIIISLIVNIIMLASCQLATPIMLFMICSIAMLALGNKGAKRLFWIVIGLVTFIVFFLFGTYIARSMVDLISQLPYSTLNNHILGILKVFSGESARSLAVDNRMEKIMISINSFMSSPLTGIRFSNVNSTTVGFHQEWVDLLASQGLVGLGILIYLLGNIHKSVVSDIKDILDKKCYYFSLFYLVLFGFFDPCLNTSVLVMVFVIAPNVSSIFT